MSKKSYDKPAVIHSEKVTTRAVVCGKATGSCDNSPPIQS